MSKIQILDCTLRDGGYVNDWAFGAENAKEMVKLIASTGVEYIELGFIKHCNYIRDVIQFNNMQQVANLFIPSKVKLAIMVEIGYGYPVNAFPQHSENTVDLVRLVVWKRLIDESVDYAKELKNKGYKVAIQATRTDQYTHEELAQFVKKFNTVNPDAFYVVDTFGLMNKEKLLSYFDVIDKNLCDNAFAGYHAHNNMQQAFSNTVAICDTNWNHDIILDASVSGIGRGAGNLCLELLFKFLNEAKGTNYKETAVLLTYEKFLKSLYEQKPWGYSIPYLLSAMYGCNPSYVPDMIDKGISLADMTLLFKEMCKHNMGIRFMPDEYMQLYDEIVKEPLSLTCGQKRA